MLQSPNIQILNHYMKASGFVNESVFVTGSFKCYIMLFSGNLTWSHPSTPRNVNNVEQYTFVTLVWKFDTPTPIVL